MMNLKSRKKIMRERDRRNSRAMSRNRRVE
jgi:hypothetical protein